MGEKEPLWRSVQPRVGRKKLRKPRPFSDVKCRNCPYKGSRYCWNQCPYNRWAKWRQR